MTIPEPQRSELLEEIAEGLDAAVDLTVIVASLPLNVPAERLAVVMQRFEDARDAVREMLEQEVSGDA